MSKKSAIKNVELKIIAILQGATNKENRMSMQELTARVYGWEQLRNEDGTLKAIPEDAFDEWICKGSEAPKKDMRYDRRKTIKDGIMNILMNYSKDFPIRIHAPLIEYEEDKKRKKILYIDEKGQCADVPIYSDKLIFSSVKDLENFVNNEIEKIQFREGKKVTPMRAGYIEQTIRDNSVRLWDNVKDKTAFPEVGEWELYYQQSYSNEEAYVILTSLISQKNLEASIINEIVGKLVKSTSDKYFEQFVKKINLETSQSTMADEYLSGSCSGRKNTEKQNWTVFCNIKEFILKNELATDWVSWP